MLLSIIHTYHSRKHTAYVFLKRFCRKYLTFHLSADSYLSSCPFWVHGHSTRSSGPGLVLQNNDNRIIRGDCFHGNGNESTGEKKNTLAFQPEGHRGHSIFKGWWLFTVFMFGGDRKNTKHKHISLQNTT